MPWYCTECSRPAEQVRVESKHYPKIWDGRVLCNGCQLILLISNWPRLRVIRRAW